MLVDHPCWVKFSIAFWALTHTEVDDAPSSFGHGRDCCLRSATALAGVVITSTHVDLDSKQSTPMAPSCDADRLKVVTPKPTVIFRGDLQRTWIITTARSSYVEITPETVRRLPRADRGARERLESRRRTATAPGQMPPAQRAQVEALPADRGGVRSLGAARAGSGSELRQGGCRQDRLPHDAATSTRRRSRAAPRTRHLHRAPFPQQRLTAADFRVLDSFSSFMGPLASSPVAPRSDYLNWNDMNKAIGFSGDAARNHPLRDADRRSARYGAEDRAHQFPADAFDLPTGLTKRESPVHAPRSGRQAPKCTAIGFLH